MGEIYDKYMAQFRGQPQVDASQQPTTGQYAQEAAQIPMDNSQMWMGTNKVGKPEVNPLAQKVYDANVELKKQAILHEMELKQNDLKLNQSVQNAPIEAKLAADKAGASKMSELNSTEQNASAKGMAKDDVTYGMIKGILGDMMGLYDTAYKSNLAGSPQNAYFARQLAGMPDKGEFSIPGFARPIGDLPQLKKAMSAVGKFTAIGNELNIRMQPMLSESFDKAGTSRILTTLVDMSKQEIPSLENNRSAAIGKAMGTVRNFLRFQKGSASFKAKIDKIAKNGNDDELRGALSNLPQLSKDDEEYLANLEKEQMNKINPRGSDNKTQMIDKDGNVYDVDVSHRHDALKMGWKEK